MRLRNSKKGLWYRFIGLITIVTYCIGFSIGYLFLAAKSETCWLYNAYNKAATFIFQSETNGQFNIISLQMGFTLFTACLIVYDILDFTPQNDWNPYSAKELNLVFWWITPVSSSVLGFMTFAEINKYYRLGLILFLILFFINICAFAGSRISPSSDGFLYKHIFRERLERGQAFSNLTMCVNSNQDYAGGNLNKIVPQNNLSVEKALTTVFLEYKRITEYIISKNGIITAAAVSPLFQLLEYVFNEIPGISKGKSRIRCVPNEVTYFFLGFISGYSIGIATCNLKSNFNVYLTKRLEADIADIQKHSDQQQKQINRTIYFESIKYGTAIAENQIIKRDKLIECKSFPEAGIVTEENLQDFFKEFNKKSVPIGDDNWAVKLQKIAGVIESK